MDWHILLFSLHVACLVGILFLLLLVARKHNSPKKSTNFPVTPAWHYRVQEISSLLTWASALTFAVLFLCSHLEVIESEDFNPNAVLFLAIMFCHMTMLCDILLIFYHRLPPRYWGFAAATILMLDSVSVVVTVVEMGTKRMTLVAQIVPPILTTLIDVCITTTAAVALRKTEGLPSNAVLYVSISAMLRLVHLVPLWIWPFLSTESGSVGVLACQYLQLLVLVYPWRYSPITLFGRRKGRRMVAQHQNRERPGDQTNYTTSMRNLVSHDSQNSAPETPVGTDGRTESVSSMTDAKV